MDRSVEYNDNRLSLYCGQMGRCYVTKQPLELGHMHCHHRIPRHFGGDDKYGNLVLVTDEVHRLLHATQPDTIAHYMLKLKHRLTRAHREKQLKMSCQALHNAPPNRT